MMNYLLMFFAAGTAHAATYSCEAIRYEYSKQDGDLMEHSRQSFKSDFTYDRYASDTHMKCTPLTEVKGILCWSQVKNEIYLNINTLKDDATIGHSSFGLQSKIKKDYRFPKEFSVSATANFKQSEWRSEIGLYCLQD